MEQYERLWQYQQIDMELEKYEKDMRNNSNRKELLKHRDFLLEQQNVLKKIESDVEVMNDRMEAISDEISRLNTAVTEAVAAFEADKPATKEDAARQAASVQKLVTTLTRYETELAKIRKDANARNLQQREVRVRAAKARAEFDRIKVIYDEEYKAASVQLEAMKKKVEAASEGIDKDFLDKYKDIKKHCTPPMTRLNNGNLCGGCNMQLSGAEMAKISAGQSYFFCENCGRIILVK